MSNSFETSLVPNTGGVSETVAISTVSAQSSALYPSYAGYVNIFSTVDCFMRMGTSPTALSTGVDQFIPGNNLLRIGPIAKDFKLAFITASGTGSVYITKES